jgi:hypothetical protein
MSVTGTETPVDKESDTEKPVTLVLKSPEPKVNKAAQNKEDKLEATSEMSNFDLLYKPMTDLSDTMKELKVDLKSDIKNSSDNQKDLLQQLEARLTTSRTTKAQEIRNDMDQKFAAQEEKISHLDQKNQTLQGELNAANVSLTSQSYRISIAEQQIEDLQAQFKTLSKTTDIEEIEILSNSIDEAKQLSREAIVLANQVEAHGRRWAIRILGLPAPPKEGGTTPTAKTIVVNFLKSRLNINHIESTDIDCCHRVGDVKDDKQIMLTRFFSRDLVDFILRRKKDLKGSGLVVLVDATYFNNKLRNNLNERIKSTHHG